jgi:hypothetical protein
MTDFDLNAAATHVERQASIAGGDWEGNPANYNADAAKLSQTVSQLAREGFLEDTLKQVSSDQSFFATPGANPRIKQIDRDTGGKVTGIEFDVSKGWEWGNMVYATVTNDLSDSSAAKK